MDALARFASVFLWIAFAVLSLIWAASAILGMYGGLVLGETSAGWRRYWREWFPVLTLVLLLFALLLALIYRNELAIGY
jgi:hypothetical protein